jgi:ribosomal protein S18 acetylase RimI-like enzyme
MIRTATSEDLPLVERLFRAFNAEIPDAPWRDDDAEEDAAQLGQAIADDVVLLSDDVGLAIASKTGDRLGFLDVLYVTPEARGTGAAADLVREAASALRDRGAEMLELEVLRSNERARAVYDRWGFSPV